MVNQELLTKAVERILSSRYGNTVTVRLADAESEDKEDESPGCTESYQGGEV